MPTPRSGSAEHRHGLLITGKCLWTECSGTWVDRSSPNEPHCPQGSPPSAPQAPCQDPAVGL